MCIVFLCIFAVCKNTGGHAGKFGYKLTNSNKNI